jgi:hypothetical protein
VETGTSTYNFSLEYSSHKGDVVVDPNPVLLDDVLFGKIEKIPIYVHNKF